MSLRRVVYYPSFDPPERWLRAMLLLSDQVVRIVPRDANHRDPAYIDRLGSLLPGAITTESPTDADRSLNKINLERLGKAMSQISTVDPAQRTEIINIGLGGKIEFPGRVSLHPSKLNDEVIHLLNKHNLIDELSTAVATSAAGEDLFVVPAEAGDLILAYLADQIARRLVCDTVTDVPIAFAVTALDGLGVNAEGRVRGALLSALLQLEIPLEINTVGLQRYVEIREEYEGIRATLNDLIASLSWTHRLSSIDDPATALESVLKLAATFHAECESFRQRESSRHVADWGVIAVGGLIKIPAAYIGGPFGALAEAVSLGITVVEKATRSDPPDANERVYRQISALRRDIINHGQIRALI